MSKCRCCAFFSHACAAPDWDAYADGIVSEIRQWNEKLGTFDVPTIFFGGGTPSLMPVGTFEKIINNIAKNFHIQPACEITLESNPGTIDDEKLAAFIAAGVNRLSVGVQSFDDARLKWLGRRHTARDAMRLVDGAMRRGIRVSGDFIYGLPGDTVADVVDTCRRINETGLQHCSMYELTIEPGTPLALARPEMPSNETMAEMYTAIAQNLHLPRYEVSNYAAPGQECRHNQNVWDGEPYIGLGQGAAGRVFMAGEWYEQMGANARCTKITSDMRAAEKVITGMRTMRGVRLTPDVVAAIDMRYVDSHPELITHTATARIAATDGGILILDEMLIKLVK